MTHIIQATDGAGATQPLAVAGYSATRGARNVLHDTLDGGIGVVYQIARRRSGTLALVYDSAADALAAQALLSRACAYQYTTDTIAGLGMRFAVQGDVVLEQDDDNSDIWYLDVDFQEVSA